MPDTPYTLTDPQNGKTYKGTYAGDLSKLGPSEIENMLKWHRDQDAQAKAISDKSLSIFTGAFAKPDPKVQNPAPSDIFAQGVQRSKTFATKTLGIPNIPDVVTLTDPEDGSSTKVKWDLARLPNDNDAETLLKAWRKQKAFDASALGGVARFTKAYVDQQNKQPISPVFSPAISKKSKLDPSGLTFTREDWQAALDQGLTAVRTEDGKSMPIEQAYPLAMKWGFGNTSQKQDAADNTGQWATNFGQNRHGEIVRPGKGTYGLGSIVKNAAADYARKKFKLPDSWQPLEDETFLGQILTLGTGPLDMATDLSGMAHDALKAVNDPFGMAKDLVKLGLNLANPVEDVHLLLSGRFGDYGVRLANKYMMFEGLRHFLGEKGVRAIEQVVLPPEADLSGFKPVLPVARATTERLKAQEGLPKIGEGGIDVTNLQAKHQPLTHEQLLALHPEDPRLDPYSDNPSPALHAQVAHTLGVHPNDVGPALEQYHAHAVEQAIRETERNLHEQEAQRAAQEGAKQDLIDLSSREPTVAKAYVWHKARNGKWYVNKSRPMSFVDIKNIPEPMRSELHQLGAEGYGNNPPVTFVQHGPDLIQGVSKPIKSHRVNEVPTLDYKLGEIDLDAAAGVPLLVPRKVYDDYVKAKRDLVRSSKPPKPEGAPKPDAPMAANDLVSASTNITPEQTPAPEPARNETPGKDPAVKPTDTVINVNGVDYHLSGKALEAYNKAKADYDSWLKHRKAEYGKGIYPKEHLDASIKAAGMQFAAVKREITGELTPKERASQSANAQKLRSGAVVETPDGPGTAQGQPVYGKVKVAMEDGTVRTYSTGDVSSSAKPTFGMEGARKWADVQAERATRPQAEPTSAAVSGPKSFIEQNRARLAELEGKFSNVDGPIKLASGGDFESYRDSIEYVVRKAIDLAYTHGIRASESMKGLIDYMGLPAQAKDDAAKLYHQLDHGLDPTHAPEFHPALDQGGIKSNGQERRQEGRQETGLLKPGEGDGSASPSPTASANGTFGLATQFEDPALAGPKSGVSVEELAKKGEQLVTSGKVSLDQAYADAAKGKVTPEHIAAAAYRGQQIKNRLGEIYKTLLGEADPVQRAALSSEENALLGELGKIHDMGTAAQSTFHQIGQALQVAFQPDYTRADVMTRAKAIAGGDIPKEFQDRLDSALKDLEAAQGTIADLQKKIEAQVKERANSPRSGSRTSGTQRKQLVDSLRHSMGLGDLKAGEALAGAGGGIKGKQKGVFFAPGTKEATITRQVNALTKLYIEEGATNLGDIIKAFQTDLPMLGREDILSLLSGEYKSVKLKADVKKMELDAALRDLKRHAELERQSFFRKAVAALHDAFISDQRQMQTGVDASPALIQGFPGLTTHPTAWLESWVPFFRSMFEGKQGYAKSVAKLHADPAFAYAKRAGISFTDSTAHYSMQEEAMMGHLVNAARSSKIPVVKQYFELLGRTQEGGTAFLNHLRLAIFKKLVNGRYTDAGLMKDMASVVNIITGRGSGRGAEAMSAPTMAYVGYAPRFLISKIQNSFLPVLVPTTMFETGAGRGAALKIWAKQVSAMVGTIYLAKTLGWNTDTDPRSSTFGAIDVPGIGTIRPFKGLTESYSLIARMGLGQKQADGSVAKPNIYNNAKILGKYIRGKAAPMAGLGYDQLAGQQMNYQTGKAQPFNLFTQEGALSTATQLFTPLAIQQAYQDRDQGAGAIIADLLGMDTLSGRDFNSKPDKPEKSDKPASEKKRNERGQFAPKKRTPLLVRPRAGGRSSFGRSSHLGVFRRK